MWPQMLLIRSGPARQPSLTCLSKQSAESLQKVTVNTRAKCSLLLILLIAINSRQRAASKNKQTNTKALPQKALKI